MPSLACAPRLDPIGEAANTPIPMRQDERAKRAGIPAWRAALASIPSAKRWLTGVIPLAALSVLLLASLLMMSEATQNSAVFGRLYSWLLVLNIIGVILLLALIVYNLRRMFRQYRRGATGSRLTLRLLLLFVMLAVAPVTVVFLFSIQTLHRGIDNWFDVRIDRALNDALLLGRTAIDAVKQDLLKSAQEIAAEIEIVSFSTSTTAFRNRNLLSTLSLLRDQHNVTELTVFASDGRILASASDAGPDSGSLVPVLPRESALTQARQGKSYANLDVVGRAGLRIRVIVPVYSREVGQPVRLLQVLQTLPARYTRLGENVQTAYAEYEKLDYLRGPLKFGFTLTLTLVALLTLLVAVWAAIFTARRVVAPIRDLAEGTRAVADGNYRLQLPVTSHDEIGVLVESFNDMTRRISRAQSESRRAQHDAERSRAYLETVLIHLSSGVISVNGRGRLRTYNAAASAILAADLDTVRGANIHRLAEQAPALAPLVALLEQALADDVPEWKSEVQIDLDGQRRVLLVRGTRLPAALGRRAGYVVVFDDVTALIQAQRHAAWGDVARRMAHEIKNPLTPIQLSAERIRHKYLRSLPEAEQATLERAVGTIIDQVEALKGMVNAFADYARPAQMQPTPVNLNDLVRDVIELYVAGSGRPADFRRAEVVSLRAADTPGGHSRTVALRLNLDKALPAITADATRLRQVLHNLLLNARDALVNVERPKIRMTTHSIGAGHEAGIELRIEDNGPGIPPELMDRLFEPYVTTKEKGTGLGLAIVQRIVEEHGGSIQAENLPDGGACVTIRLPHGQAQQAPDASRQEGGRARRRAGDGHRT